MGEKRSFLYETVRGLSWLVCHTVMPVVFHDREKLDREAPYILIANHQHALDPVVMALGVRGRQVVFLAKKQLGSNRAAAWALKRVHCIFVDRHNMDMEAMRACVRAIRERRILVIFPEGTRHHEGQMEQIESGTALLTMRSGVPLIPMYIERKLSLFRRNHVYVGDPIPYDDLAAGGINAVSCEALNERIRETYRRMIAAAKEKNRRK
ncbi:MAG: 1-acyl-sn-glycerol-3-phosphate acyltransferase [Clostridia bacterium]|nr:1-acyl-sn-glycerol-3-phosphate acyltransferase [Clostridia bacterium]